MKKMICAGLFGMVLLAACNKRTDTGGVVNAASEVVRMAVPVCGKKIVTDKPVKVGETGIVLPVNTKLCFSSDNLEIRIELPAGFSFITKESVSADKSLPIWATYTCACSASGSACQVFYADGLGFGCLQSTCSGSCTGKFTYKGYTVERVAYTDEKEKFFVLPEVQDMIAKVPDTEAYRAFFLYDVKFAVVNNEKAFLEKATCDCEGTQACKLKVVNIPFLKGTVANKKIYYCTGGCNSCELTVS